MKKLSIVFVLIWMVFIFYNSSNSADISNKKSLEFVNILRNSKNIVLNEGNKDKVNKIESQSPTNENQLPEIQNHLDKCVRDKKSNLVIRKNAHAFEYAVLAILVSNMFIVYGMRGKNAIIYILFFSLFYAVTDEFHQSFVTGRTSLVTDVLIDFLGSVIGLTTYYLYKFKLFYRKN